MNEIPRDALPTFCDEFSRQHLGWLASVELCDTALLDADPTAAATAGRTLVHEVVLQGITAERRDANFEITIIAGEGSHRLTHPVLEPKRVVLEESAEGAHKGLRIDAADGMTTRVRFRVAAVPEELDGLAKTER